MPSVSCRCTADQILSIYKCLLEASLPDANPPLSYNLLVTKQHVMLVPRRKELIGAVGINALGFAGTILINSRAGLQHVKDQGPLPILEAAGCPW